MADEHIVTEIDGAVLTLRFNREEKKNALTVAMYSEMTKALGKLEQEDSLRVLLIEGGAEIFTSGNDIADFQRRSDLSEESGAAQFLFAIQSARKPVIAAVNGPAIGIGTTMLLHCDLVYAGDQALFQLPFINLGLIPEAGSSYILPHMLGHQRSAELLYFGERFDAATAKELGFVNKTMPANELASFARAQAQRLAAQPPSAVQMTKSLIKEAGSGNVKARIEKELGLFAERLASPEAREAFTAFMEKRAPDFSKF